MRQGIRQSQLRISLDVGVILTYGASGDKIICDTVAFARICCVDRRTNIVVVGRWQWVNTECCERCSESKL